MRLMVLIYNLDFKIAPPIIQASGLIIQPNCMAAGSFGYAQDELIPNFQLSTFPQFLLLVLVRVKSTHF